jgi:hypothetical protein
MLKSQVNELFRDYEGFCRENKINPSYNGFKAWITNNLKSNNWR